MKPEPDPATAQASSASLDEAVFMRLLMRHEPALRAFARSLLPNWDLVDEAIQEASLTIWRKFDQLEDEEGFLPWAKVIVRYKCLSEIGKIGRDRHVFSERVLEMIADEAALIEAESHESSMKALRHCLQKFSKGHQELLLAPYESSGRVKAMATEAGKSANALYKLLGRLREKLSDCVQVTIHHAAQ